MDSSKSGPSPKSSGSVSENEPRTTTKEQVDPGFIPPDVPFSNRFNGNRTSYMSTLSNYSAHVENVEHAKEQQPIKVVIHHEDANESDTSVNTDSKSGYPVNLGKIPTIRQASAGKKSDFNYNTHVGGSVPPRSPRRPKSDIISGKLSEELNKELEKFNNSNKRLSLNDDLNEIMAKAKSIGGIDLDQVRNDDVDANASDPFKEISSAPAATVAGVLHYDAEETQRLAPDVTLDDVSREGTSKNLMQQQHLYENSEHSNTTIKAPLPETDPVASSIGAAAGTVLATSEGATELQAPHSSEDYTQKDERNPDTMSVFSGENIAVKEAHDDVHTTQEPPQPVDQEATPQRKPADFVLPVVGAPTHLQQQQIAEQLRQLHDNSPSRPTSKAPVQPPPLSPSQKLKLSQQDLLLQQTPESNFNQVIGSKQRSLPPRPTDENIIKAREVSNATRARVDLFGIENASDFNSDASSLQKTSVHLYQPETELDVGGKHEATGSSKDIENDMNPEHTKRVPEDDNNDYYDIGEPVIIKRASTQRKSKTKGARRSKRDKELKPFSYHTLINLLESMNGTIIGEEFSQLNLPEKEKQLIEKIIDSLSRLTSDMVIDQTRYNVGIERLEKALRVLEGFM